MGAPKERTRTLIRVVYKEKKTTLSYEFHDSHACPRATWETFAKLKQKYWWPRIYEDVTHYFNSRYM